MNNPSFLIVGTNFINKGAEAMMKTVSHQVLNKYPNADIHVICHKEERDVATSQGFHPLYIDVHPLSRLIEKVIGKLKQIAGLANKPYADYTPMNQVKAIKNLKTVIDASGFAYGDKRGYQQPLESQKIIDYCKTIGVPYIIMPQAWGSFKDPQVAQNVRQMLESCDRYYTRDDVSRAYVADLLSKSIEDIPILPDIAFHFPIPDNDGRELIRGFGFDTSSTDKPILGISPNMRIYERMSGIGVDNEYINTVIQLIKHYRDQFHIILIPNEIRPGQSGLKDDAYLCQLIYDTLPDKSGLTLVRGYHTAEEIKAIIREVDILIASRFHSLIFALSLGIPSMAISWSHKYRELFRIFDLERFVVEDKGLKLEKATTLFDELWQNRKDISEQISNELPKLKARNAEVFELI